MSREDREPTCPSYQRLRSGFEHERDSSAAARAGRTLAPAKRSASSAANVPVPCRFATYSRVASAISPREARLAHDAQRLLCRAAVLSFAGRMTATFHDTGVAFTLPLRERAGGSALLAASGFDAVITASLSRLGHGYLALAEARISGPPRRFENPD